MSFSPGKDRNFLGALRRTMQYGWWGNTAQATQFGQPPTLLNGESVTSINAANTGVIKIVGVDANNQIVYAVDLGLALTAAQIITLNTVPVQLVAAPGAGKAIVPGPLILEMTRTGTAFTGGGVVGPVYAGATGTFLTANQMAAADVTTGGAGTVTRLLLPASTAGGVSLTANVALQLFAATANFAAGTGTMKAFVTYSIVTL